jgi:hypothetical protein
MSGRKFPGTTPLTGRPYSLADWCNIPTAQTVPVNRQTWAQVVTALRAAHRFLDDNFSDADMPDVLPQLAAALAKVVKP